MRPALALALILAAPAAAFTPVAVVEGIGRVIDGDTLDVGRVRVRLQGVAAPEAGTTAGRDAALGLRALAEGQPVRCELDGTTTRGREVGRCYAQGVEVGAELIGAGLARDCPRFSGGRYAGAEKEAQHAGRALSRSYALPGYCRPR